MTRHLHPLPAIAGALRPDDETRRRLETVGPSIVDDVQLVVVGDAAVGTASGGTVCVLAGAVDAWAGEAPPAGVPDAVHFATLFERRGPAAFDAARGAWVALLWKPSKGRCVVARDPFGARSLHHWTVAGGVFFGEDVRDVIAAAGRTPAPSGPGVALWLSDARLRDGESLYRDVLRVPSGHYTELSAGRPPEPYFELRYPGRSGLVTSLADAVDLTREAVDDAVRRAASPGTVGVLLSGGLDSSTIAASAVATLGAGRVHGISSVFPDHEAADESALISSTVAQLGIAHDPLAVRVQSALPRWRSAVDEWKLPPPFGLGFVYAPMVERAAELGFTRVLTGQGGDEVFFNDPYLYITDLLLRARFVRAWRLAGSTPVAPANPRARVKVLKQLVRPLRRGQVRAQADGGDDDALRLLAPALAAAVVEDRVGSHWRTGGGPLWWQERHHTISTFREGADVAGGLRRQARSAGVEERHPLLHDRDLIEACCRVAPALLFDRRFDRAVARQAVASRVPEAVAFRPVKSHFTDVVTGALETIDRAAAQELLGSDARVREYLTDGALDRRIHIEPSAHPGGRYGWMYEVTRLAGVELWLRGIEG